MLPEFTVSAPRDFPGLHIVALHGELDIASANGLTDTLVEVAGSTLVVDLSELTFMDAKGIAALVRARERILAEGLGELVLTRPAGIVLRVLEVVGLSSWVVEWSSAWDA